MISAVLLIIIIFLIYNIYYTNKDSQKHKPTQNETNSKSQHTGGDGCNRQTQQPQPTLDCDEHQTDGYLDDHIDKPYASDYSEFMISSSLDPDVVDSHKTFTDEIQNNTTGPSAQTIFSHDDSIVPRWGLRRSSAYIPINPNSREVPSQTNEQINQNSSKLTYGYF